MEDVIAQIKKSVSMLTGELENFQEIARYIKPAAGETPKLPGIEIYGETIPLNGIVGGDHIIYVDFNKRYDLDARIQRARERGWPEVAENLEACRHKAGIVVADVSGHQITDAMLAGMLHQAFLTGIMYELYHYGKVTWRLFENLNTRFHNSSSVSKFLTMIYGEISEDGMFRFIDAGHPMPIVFSQEFNRIVDVPETLMTSFPPIGTLPSEASIDRRTNHSVLGFKEKYEVNKLDLMGAGDIMVLYTDGLIEHERDGQEYYPGQLEPKLRAVKHLSAGEIWEAIRKDLFAFSKPADDISYVVIKRL